MIGRTLDRYRIESKLGEGGMGVVYKARDTELNRDVALKILPPEKVPEANRKQRFIREARAASALNHPNIVTVHDVRSVEGIDFIVMEHVDGRPLSEIIPPRGLPLPLALQYGTQMASALAAAHGAGILHRDLKPSNVMITSDGRAKILDFGLAKLTETVDTSPDAPTVPAAITEEGVIVGTAAYMSPEQTEGQPVDARSDIFSLGIVLYEMTTGRKPFTGNSRVAILHSLLHDEPPSPRQTNAGIPLDLEKGILRCLRKDPARRFQTMSDLKAALDDLRAESETLVTGPARRARSRKLWSPVAIVAFVLLAAGAALVFFRRSTRSAIATPSNAVALTTFAGVERYPSFSPDGNQVVFTWNGPAGDNEDLYVQMIGSGSPLRLTTDALSDFNPAWSPDGRWIAFLRGVNGMVTQNSYELLLIPPLGGPERRVTSVRVHNTSDVPPSYIAWCPDSTCLVITDAAKDGKRDALYVVSIDTGEKRALIEPPTTAMSDSSPALSPDGRTLVFRHSLEWGIGEIHALPLGDRVTRAGEPRLVLARDFNGEHPAWLPNGKEILVSAKSGLWKASVFSDEAPTRLPFVGEDGFLAAIAPAKGGHGTRLVYARSYTDFNIWRIDMSAPGVASTVPPRVAIASTRMEIHAQLSPDAKRVAFTSTRSGDWEIWVSDPDGANAVQLTSMKAQATGGPRWSNDGRWIAFGSNQPGNFDLFMIPSTGGNPRRLTNDPAFDQSATFSRDGRSMYFSSTRTGEYQIWKMPFGGGAATQITTRGGWYGVEAPDARSLYYTHVDDVNGVLWQLPFDSRAPQRVLDGLVWWGFTPVDAGIYYFDRAASNTRLRFLEFATGATKTVAENLGDVRWVPSATPDGRTLFYSKVDSSTDDLMLAENF
ncbi:MAG TPA: protein kinase [Thermoanaerobaculia bacterium]|nr:protein kinase [Thermoanaerobaculia bacterium]